MTPRKVPSTIRWDPDQKETLDLISRFSRGTPTVSALLREAIQQYIESTFEKDDGLRQQVMAEKQRRRKAIIGPRSVIDFRAKN